jgi:hypothetical protein
LDKAPTPLFEKRDEANVEVENEMRGRPWQDPEGKISEEKAQPSVVIFEDQIRTRAELGEDWG